MENQKNNGGLIALVIVLCLLVLGLGGYIFCDKVLNNKKLEDNSTNNSTAVLKADSAKDWVYDADYNLPTNKESYYGYSDHSKLVKASDLIVPYININSSDATKANQEIYGLYEQLINTFNENLKEEIWFTTVEYSSNIKNDVLSVVIKTTSEGTAEPIYGYYTYNFNTSNGNLLSYEDAYKLVNIDSSNIESIAKQKITDVLNDIYQGSQNDSYNDSLHTSVDNYIKSVNDETIKYYFDNNGKLNVVVNVILPASGDPQRIIVIG